MGKWVKGADAEVAQETLAMTIEACPRLGHYPPICGADKALVGRVVIGQTWNTRNGLVTPAASSAGRQHIPGAANSQDELG